MPYINSEADTIIRNSNFQWVQKLKLTETNLRKNYSTCTDLVSIEPYENKKTRILKQTFYCVTFLWLIILNFISNRLKRKEVVK